MYWYASIDVLMPLALLNYLPLPIQGPLFLKYQPWIYLRTECVDISTRSTVNQSSKLVYQFFLKYKMPIYPELRVFILHKITGINRSSRLVYWLILQNHALFNPVRLFWWRYIYGRLDKAQRSQSSKQYSIEWFEYHIFYHSSIDQVSNWINQENQYMIMLFIWFISNNLNDLTTASTYWLWDPISQKKTSLRKQ